MARTQMAITVALAAVLAFAALATSTSTSTSNTASNKRTVVVVGAGLAGLSASIEAVRSGARVILLDKEPRHGGNSAKATSGINGVGTPAQDISKVKDSIELFMEDTLASGRGLCSDELVLILGEDSRDAIKFIEDLGIELRTISRLGGHSAARTHREPNKPDGTPRPVGFDIVTALKKHTETFDASVFEFRPNSRVTRLLQDPKTLAVTGVEYELREPGKDAQTITLHASAVILATGGYSAARDTLLRENAPSMTFLPSTNGPWAQGEGIALGKQVGAHPMQLDKVQVHPTGFVDPRDPTNMVKFLAPEALRGSGAILLNRHGRRFVDELAPRDTVTGAIYRFSATDGGAGDTDDEGSVPLHEAKPRRSEAFMVLDDEGVALFGTAAFGFYHKAKGFFTKVSGLQGLAEEMARVSGAAVSVDTLSETFAAYTAAALGTERDAYGKTHFPTHMAGAAVHADFPMYVGRITPSIHYTMGGLEIDADARILTSARTPGGIRAAGFIANLFGAGEVTGGVHGANRLAGNSLLECVVFGRIAGRNAAQPVDHDLHDEL